MVKKRYLTSGDRFDKLILLREETENRNGYKRTYWNCKCDCGNTTRKREDYFFRGIHQSCGCDTASIQAANCKRIKWKGTGLLGSTVYTAYKRNAQARNINFNITIQDAWKQFEKQNGMCALSGVKIGFSDNTRWRRNSQTASLDRIDSQGGYTIDNIQWVHKTVNLMKNVLNEKEFIQWCKHIIEHAVNRTQVSA